MDLSRILLVDNSESLLRIADEFLSREEPLFDVATNVSSREALQRLRKDEFDVVVSDYRMPDIDGLELLQILRNEGNNIPFIMLTGQGREEVAMKALNLGANYYLMKGDNARTTFGELAHIIRQLVQYKRTELELREKTHWTQVFLDALPCVALVLGPNREVVACNAQGAAAGATPGKRCFATWGQRDDPCPWCRAPLALSSQKAQHIVVEALGIVWDAHWIPLGDDLYFHYAFDITKQQKADQELRKSEENHRTLFDSMGDAVFIHDLQWRFLEVNQVACDRYGYTREEFLQLSFADLVTQEYLSLGSQRIEKMLQQGHLVLETVHKCRDGRIIPNEVNTRVIDYQGKQAVLAIARDITDRKRAEEALRESEERFRMLAEQNLMGIAILQGNRIIYANEEVSKINEHSLEELMNLEPNEFAKLIHPADRPFAMEQAQKKQSGIEDGAIAHYSYRIIPKSGNIKWVDQYSKTIQYQGKPADFVILVDSTERKLAEEQLRRQKEELSEFVHAMSHDLINSLLSVEGYAEVLETEYDKAYVEKIAQLATNMNNLLRRSVALADAGLIIQRTDEVELGELVRAVAKASIPTKIIFSSDITFSVIGDREKLSQAFQNIFENAVTHGKPRHIEVRSHCSGNGRAILISNDGVEIPQEKRAKIFQRGFSTKKDGKGLGMAIVQRVIEAHGWQISLDATPQTSFRIIIPQT